MSGTLFAVVGPSGAGKDSLIAYARARLTGDPGFAFPARCITRPPDAGGEDHISVTTDRFTHMRAAGAFVLDWEAHGLSYGIPEEVVDMTDAGTSVIVNLSRSVTDEVRRKFPGARIVHVTAPPDVIARRLATRARESAADIEARLRRTPSSILSGADVVCLNNAGALEEAGDALVDLLIRHAGQTARV